MGCIPAQRARPAQIIRRPPPRDSEIYAPGMSTGDIPISSEIRIDTQSHSQKPNSPYYISNPTQEHCTRDNSSHQSVLHSQVQSEQGEMQLSAVLERNRVKRQQIVPDENFKFVKIQIMDFGQHSH